MALGNHVLENLEATEYEDKEKNPHYHTASNELISAIKGFNNPRYTTGSGYNDHYNNP